MTQISNDATAKAASLGLVNILPDGKFVITKRGEEVALRIFREMEDFESVCVYALVSKVHDSVKKNAAYRFEK